MLNTDDKVVSSIICLLYGSGFCRGQIFVIGFGLALGSDTALLQTVTYLPQVTSRVNVVLHIHQNSVI